MRIKRIGRPDWVFTDEEVAAAQAEVDAIEAKALRIGAMREEQNARLAQIERPNIELTNNIERVIYYLSAAKDEVDLTTRVLKGTYSESWSADEWACFVKDTVNILCSEFGNADLARRLSAVVEEYKTLPAAKREMLLVNSIDKDVVTLPKLVMDNKNKI